MQNTERLKSVAHDYILKGLISGKFKSGKYLNIDVLCQSLSMSKTPIRDALVKLESENLVSREGRYYYVFTLSSKEVKEIYELKRILEGEAAFIAATRATNNDLDNMGNAIDQISSLLKTSDPDPVLLADLSGNFHKAVAIATGNSYIVKYIEELRLKLRIIRVSLFTVINRRLEDLNEHKAVFNAILSGDANRSKKLMVAHQDKVINYVDENLLIQFY